MRRLHLVHLAITLALAGVLCVVLVVSARHDGQLREQVQSRARENTALRKRAETAEANTKLVIERFGEAMRGIASETRRLSGRTLGEHEKSFVQVYSFYRRRGTDMATAGTACYLGAGYFLTAKHVVVQEAAAGERSAPRTTKIEMRVKGRPFPVQLVDKGDDAPGQEQVDTADWAVLYAPEVPEGLVPLKPRAAYPFVFGERLVRYGNDSNRGIAVAAGYVAQVSDSGWISWLVDSLPGCSGGGVLNGHDELVGLNGGYLDGSTRLAVIIPIRSEMFRKLPKGMASAIEDPEPVRGLQ